MASIIELERRALLIITGCTMVSFFFMVISVCTDYWLIIDIPEGLYRNSSQSYVIKTYSGLWRICRVETSNLSQLDSTREHCEPHKLFPSKRDVRQDPEIDQSILDYSRTETAFAVISLFIMLMAHGFAYYSFKEIRYMFKRLTACLHFISAACVLVAIEVMVNSVKYEEENLPARHPPGSSVSYGFSFILAWFPFLIYLAAGILFLVCSRKRKGEKAVSSEEAESNEPVALGRI